MRKKRSKPRNFRAAARGNAKAHRSRAEVLSSRKKADFGKPRRAGAQSSPDERAMGGPAPATLQADFHRMGDHAFGGYVVDLANPDRRFVVEFIVDGLPIQIARASEYSHPAASKHLGDGCYGFSFTLPAETLSDGVVVEARLANTGIAIGQPLEVPAERAKPDAFAPGRFRWIGGLRFIGWLKPIDDGAPHVRAIIDGVEVADAHARLWHHEGSGHHDSAAVPAFDLSLPPRFADGRVRSVRIVRDSGEDLPGSPLTFVAFEDGLEQAIATLGGIDSERLRGELFDRLVPMSIPFHAYAKWRERFPLPAPEIIDEPVAVILVGGGDVEASLESLERQTHQDWVATVLPAAAGGGGFDPALLSDFLNDEAAGCNVVVFAVAGLEFEPDAIARLLQAGIENADAIAIYGDLSVAGDVNNSWPIALPAFDYERMLEQGYCAFLFATPRARVERATAVDATSLYRVFNALIDDPQESMIVHLPGSLGVLPDIDCDVEADLLAAATADHLGGRGIEVEITPANGEIFPAVRVARLADQPTTSIVIPVRNRVELLRRCLETIGPAAAKASAEILIVDNDSSEPDMLGFLRSIEGRSARVVRAPGFFNFARLNNLAARAARGDVLCLLNNDVEAEDDDWLDEMLSRLAEPDTGAVGAMLVWPSGIVQHGGVVLGPSLAAVHAFNDRLDDDPGYTDLLRVAHEGSAVTAACMVTRKADYLAVDGFDEVNFPVNFNDVDYCLKLRAQGKRIVFTPHARLLHLESASRGVDLRSERAARFERELTLLRARWLEAIVADPYYNPTLSLDGIPFSALAWPPRSTEPRVRRKPVATPVAVGV